MAMLTSKAQVGCLVTCNTYRNPALLSDMAKTVDHISGGRLILGLGAGWFERDYKEFGYDFGTAGSRLEALENTLKIIKHRWEIDVPKSVNGSIPILIGGGGEKKTLRLTAKYADMWHGFGDPETIAHKMAVLNDWCAKEGRDPNDIERSCGTNANDSDEVRDGYVKAGISHLFWAWAHHGISRPLKSWSAGAPHTSSSTDKHTRKRTALLMERAVLF